jgi:hypothetical protein
MGKFVIGGEFVLFAREEALSVPVFDLPVVSDALVLIILHSGNESWRSITRDHEVFKAFGDPRLRPA